MGTDPLLYSGKDFGSGAVWAIDFAWIVEEEAPELRSRSEVEEQRYLQRRGTQVIKGLGFM